MTPPKHPPSMQDTEVIITLFEPHSSTYLSWIFGSTSSTTNCKTISSYTLGILRLTNIMFYKCLLNGMNFLRPLIHSCEKRRQGDEEALRSTMLELNTGTFQFKFSRPSGKNHSWYLHSNYTIFVWWQLSNIKPSKLYFFTFIFNNFAF